MTELTNEELIEKAKKLAEVKELSTLVRAGDVGSALITDKGNVYIGTSIDACCGVGFCAEHTAIGNMVTNKEYRIKKIVAVMGDGRVLPPCGRCREFMYEINKENLDTDVILGKDKVVKLRDLLQEIWQKIAFSSSK